MKIASTSDIDARALQVYVERLQDELGIEISTKRAGFKSVEPPSWIVFLADLDWWVTVLGIPVGFYVKGIAQEAGKSTWTAISRWLTTSRGNKVTKLANNLSELKAQVPERTKLEIGLPFPNDFFATRLTLNGTDATAIAIEIGLFLHHLPNFDGLVKSEGLTEDTVATAVFLVLNPNGSLEVSWFDSESHRKEVRTLPLTGS